MKRLAIAIGCGSGAVTAMILVIVAVQFIAEGSLLLLGKFMTKEHAVYTCVFASLSAIFGFLFWIGLDVLGPDLKKNDPPEQVTIGHMRMARYILKWFMVSGRRRTNDS